MSIDGSLSEHAVYTVEGLNKAIGMGRQTLTEARQSGMVRSVLVGKRRVYFGEEIVKYLRHLQQQQAQGRDAECP